MNQQQPQFLSEKELAARWRISHRSLERWRALQTGPAFVRLGGKIRYDLRDVETYERRRRASTHSSIVGSWK